MDQRDPRDRRNALACGGCVLSAAGATVATYAWASSSRTRRHMGGFEGEGTDYTVLVTEMPLVALAGAALPALACAVVAVLAGRRRRARRSDLDR